jgi:hypothetical protein
MELLKDELEFPPIIFASRLTALVAGLFYATKTQRRKVWIWFLFKRMNCEGARGVRKT